MELSAVFRKYASEGDGQLALKFSGVPHLCKVAIEGGEAVFIKLGLLSPEDSLAAIRGKKLLEASFIKGVKTRKRLPRPVTDELLRGDATAQDAVGAVVQHDDTGDQTAAGGSVVPAKKVSRLVNDYIDFVGPLGVVMMENYFKNTNYIQGQPMDLASYNDLVNKLMLDIGEEVRSEFYARHM